MANMSTDLRGDMFSLSEKLQSSMKDLSTDLLEDLGKRVATAFPLFSTGERILLIEQ